MWFLRTRLVVRLRPQNASSTTLLGATSTGNFSRNTWNNLLWTLVIREKYIWTIDASDIYSVLQQYALLGKQVSVELFQGGTIFVQKYLNDFKLFWATDLGGRKVMDGGCIFIFYCAFWVLLCIQAM